MPSAFGVPTRSVNRYVAPPAMTLLATLTASKSASLVYTGFDSLLYKIYFLLFRGLVPNDGANSLIMTGSTDGGANYDTLWYNSLTRNTGDGLGSFAGGTNPSAPTQTMNIIGGVSTISGFPVSANGTGYLSFGLPGTDDTAWYCDMLGFAGDRPLMQITKSYYRNTTPVNTLKWIFDTGTIKRGSILIFGVGG